MAIQKDYAPIADTITRVLGQFASKLFDTVVTPRIAFELRKTSRQFTREWFLGILIESRGIWRHLNFKQVFSTLIPPGIRLLDFKDHHGPTATAHFGP
jgi:hypothetical protein